MKKIINNITPAAYFWNGLIYVAFIICGFINPVSLLAIASIGSVFLLVSLLDGPDKNYLLWAPLTFLFWIGLVVILISEVGEFLYIRFIIRFNNWLNSHKKEK